MGNRHSRESIMQGEGQGVIPALTPNILVIASTSLATALLHPITGTGS